MAFIAESSPDVHLNLNVRGLSQSATLAINERSARLHREGRDVYRLGLGQSPFPVAAPVVEELRSKGYSAYHVSADLMDKGVWYRVRIGPLRTKTQAFTMLNTVKKEYKTAIVIKK